MKVILTGSTGFIGKEVLYQCLSSPKIDSVVALSRRELPKQVANPKLTVIIVEDFKTYTSSVLEQLKDADACIWSMGTYNWDKVVELEYPKAFQQALQSIMDGKKSFRYVYLGGAFTETDQEKTLWFYSEGRRIRGLAQSKFLEFGEENPSIKTHIVRPAGVLSGDGIALLGPVLGTVSVRRLAAVMVDLAVNGGNQPVVENKVIRERGKLLLMNRK